MADQNAGQVPDLASVLANLASLAIQQQPPPVAVMPTQDPRPVPLHRRSTPQMPQMTATRTPVIDPATIIDWPQGLRCVSKIAARNPNFKTVLQKMITDQDKHELEWYHNCPMMISRFQLTIPRFGMRKSLEAQRATPEELEAYDMKVWRASRQMVDAMTAQLKNLGVPFFGVVPEKIMSAEEASSGQLRSYQPTSSRPTRITEEELLALQRKMLEYLEDMYRG
ncbi:hypothetical protein K490DRAFT_43651 [Saccharata proteae CBS 121410]|uniref:Uncharacterized protein n=1 Tax=Saccharata proteae CBS 121410 TaxID=1314787 RepID=A0A9P4LWP1_9PEZI|nr:hypothetical protein K490DRAFT_43651 [Saccharata proteae CBS 121410]